MLFSHILHKEIKKKGYIFAKRIMVPVTRRMTQGERVIPLMSIPKAMGQTIVFLVACPDHCPHVHKRTICLWYAGNSPRYILDIVRNQNLIFRTILIMVIWAIRNNQPRLTTESIHSAVYRGKNCYLSNYLSYHIHNLAKCIREPYFIWSICPKFPISYIP